MIRVASGKVGSQNNAAAEESSDEEEEEEDDDDWHGRGHRFFGGDDNNGVVVVVVVVACFAARNNVLTDFRFTSTTRERVDADAVDEVAIIMIMIFRMRRRGGKAIMDKGRDNVSFTTDPSIHVAVEK